MASSSSAVEEELVSDLPPRRGRGRGRGGRGRGDLSYRPPALLKELVQDAAIFETVGNRRRRIMCRAEERFQICETHNMMAQDILSDQQNKITALMDTVDELALEVVLTRESLAARQAWQFKSLHDRLKYQKMMHDMSLAFALAKATAVPITLRPDPKFRPGQSVCQFWAPWFRLEPLDSTREKASKKDRAVWYIGEVLGGPKYMSIVYAGVFVEDHCYYVH